MTDALKKTRCGLFLTVVVGTFLTCCPAIAVERVVCVFPEKSQKLRLLRGMNDSAFVYQTTLTEEVFSDESRVSILDGSPQHLRFLVDHRPKVEKMVRNGGWILLWEITPDSLADFNRLVEVEHRLARVEIGELRDIELSKPDPLLDRLIRVRRWVIQPVSLFFHDYVRKPVDYALRVEAASDSDYRVKPLAAVGKCGVLNKYARGKGGIMACQLGMPDEKLPPRGLATILANLLKNMGHSFDSVRGSPRHPGTDDFRATPGAVKVFWSGASFLNPVSMRVADLVNEHQDDIQIESYYGGHCPPDKLFHRYRGETMLRDVRPDFIVMGVASNMRKSGLVTNKLERNPAETEAILRETDKVAAIVRESGGKVIVWNPWNYEAELACFYREGPPRPQELKDHLKGCGYCRTLQATFSPEDLKKRWRLGVGLYKTQAKRYDSLYVPAGEAWVRAFETYPKIDLYNRGFDRHHGNDYGVYLAACVFYAAFTGRSPTELPVDTAVSARAVERSMPAGANPQGLIRFLQKTAWDVYREHVEAGELEVRVHRSLSTVSPKGKKSAR